MRANKIKAKATIQVTSIELVMQPSSLPSPKAFCGMPCSACPAGAPAAAIPSATALPSATTGCSAAGNKGDAANSTSATRIDFIDDIGLERGVSGRPVPLLKYNVFSESAGKIAAS